MNEITFEYEFVIDHEDFKGSISCSKTIKTHINIDDTDAMIALHEASRHEALEEFLTRFTMIDKR